jgi:hypothetical protein
MLQWLESLKLGEAPHVAYDTKVGFDNLGSLKDQVETVMQIKNGLKNNDNLQNLDQLINNYRKFLAIFKWTLAQADQLKADSESKT